jgi:hypothetical protein
MLWMSSSRGARVQPDDRIRIHGLQVENSSVDGVGPCLSFAGGFFRLADLGFQFLDPL